MRVWILLLLMVSISISKKPKGETVTEEGEVSVTKNTIDGPLFDIVWCGKDYNPFEDDSVQSPPPAKLPKRIFTLSHSGTLFLSKNDGEDWEPLTSTFQNLLPTSKNYTFSLLRLMTTKSSHTKIFVQTNSNLTFYTNDCGDTFMYFETNFTMFDVRHSNSNENWILALEKIKCENENVCPNVFNLYLTTDSGANWRLVSEGIFDATWAILEKKSAYYSSPENRIIFTKYELIQKNSEQEVKTYVGYTDNFFSTETKLSNFGYKFYLTKHYLFVLDSKKLENRDFQLKISQTYDTTYSLKPIKIPVERIKDFSFTILDAEMGVIFLNINHNGEESRFGNVYVSDNYGTSYSLSLVNNVRDKSGFSDFEKIHSMEGTYIANVFDHEKAERVKLLLQTSSNEKTKVALKDLDTAIKTMISYDRGASWHTLKAPAKNWEGKPIKCVGECSLHLRGLTDQSNNPIYSSKSAVGIIMGVGNIGSHLSEKPDEVNTYFSRDGGITWFEIRKGSHIYEIGDHGALIVLADDTGPSDKIHFSWDEGLTWTEIKIVDNPIDITNIIIEPSNMAQKFIVYGEEQDENGKSVGVLVTLDFESLHTRVCSGIWEPGSSKSDYEIWIPSSYKGDKCIMGKKVKYVRRKRDALCFNGEEKDRTSLVDFCACTEEDWECNFEFVRDAKTNECVPDSEKAKEKIKSSPPVNCQNFYLVNTGYRKIPGDFCVGGVDMSVKNVQCPNVSTPQSENKVTKEVSGANESPFSGEKNPNPIVRETTVIPDEPPILVKEINSKLTPENHKKPKINLDSEEKPFSVKIFNYFALLLVILLLAKYREEIKSFFSNILERSKAKPSEMNGYKLKEYERVQINHEDDDED